MKKLLTMTLLSAFLLVACGGASMKAGDGVLVDWAGDQYSWHKAALVAECGEAEAAGWTVDFTDDFYDNDEGEDPDCVVLANILKEEVPSKAAVGDEVLGEWVESFYNAKVSAVEDGKYHVIYDDGLEDDLDLDQLRVKPVAK
ncbi:MAG: hypothetical protein O3B47_02295 [bacterium]|nr:hypothetical protein [bacterium]